MNCVNSHINELNSRNGNIIQIAYTLIPCKKDGEYQWEIIAHKECRRKSCIVANVVLGNLLKQKYEIAVKYKNFLNSDS